MGYDYEDYPEYQEPENEQAVETTVTIQWSNEAVVKGVVESLTKRIYNDFHGQIEAAIFAKLDDVVNEAIGDVMKKKVQPADRFGEPEGEEQSIRDVLMQDVEKWLNCRVDQYGRAESGGYGNRQTRASYLFKKAMNGDDRSAGLITGMVKEAIKKDVGDISALVDEEVERQLAKRFGGKKRR